MFIISRFLIRFLFLVSTCSIWDQQYSSGVLHVTQNYLFFIEAVQMKTFCKPLTSFQDIKRHQDDSFLDGILLVTHHHNVKFFLFSF